MTFMMEAKKVHHWFPRVSHMSEDYADYEDTPDTMIVDDRHDLPPISAIFRRRMTIPNIIFLLKKIRAETFL